MKKKGFTLIELLGVIIVLAIIALIAVPTILGVIDKAKKGALKDSAYGLIEAANLYYAQYGVSNTERFNLEEENELKYKGKVESGTVLLNSKGKVMVCINDSGNAAYKNYNDNEVVVVSGKTCNVNTSETQVLLDGEKTIDELTNQELTDLVNSLQEQIDELKNDKTDNTRTDEVEEVVSTKADATTLTNLSNQHTTDINRIDNNVILINNKLNNIMNYSVEEKVVGKWIDNSTIYSKTVELNITREVAEIIELNTSLSITYEDEVLPVKEKMYRTNFLLSDIGLENMDKLINFKGYAIVDGGKVNVNFPCNLSLGNATLDGYYSKINKNFVIYAGNQYSNATIYVTFYYTKSF